MAERTGLEPVLACFDVCCSDANPLIQKESCHHANTAENQNAAKVRQTSSAFAEWMAPFLGVEQAPANYQLGLWDIERHPRGGVDPVLK